MPPLTVHPPDPKHPKGMAFILGCGMADPRPGNPPNQIMAIVQSWEPTSEMWWDLGIRWHPELATKWVKPGTGGQFAVAEIVTEKPEQADMTLEEAAEEVLAFIGEEHPEYAEMLRRIHAAGTTEDRDKLAKQYEGEIKNLMTIAQYLQAQPQEG
jgi:hypothetical protein